jgi:hypothetical protein
MQEMGFGVKKYFRHRCRVLSSVCGARTTISQNSRASLRSGPVIAPRLSHFQFQPFSTAKANVSRLQPVQPHDLGNVKD